MPVMVEAAFNPLGNPADGFAVGLFAGKTVAVTGAGNGIGRAIAQAFARLRARVIMIDKSSIALERAAEGFGSDAQLSLIVSDLADGRQLDALCAEIGSMPRLDALVNSAGVFDRAVDPLRWGADLWKRTLDINLNAPARLCHAAVSGLAKSGGSIVNIVSTRAFTAAAGASGYTVSKAGLVGLTHAMAVDFAKIGVRVNAVAPGEVATSMGDIEASILHSLLARVPAGRQAAPEEIASVALFLVSPMASYVNGAIWRVDGGFLSS
jgi:NAD(P)-dependent dehydrogenase (short-subunit alcohol dehydrogenase family)